MHSHDRTMLAKFGFADADLKNPQHDLACEYLVTGDRPESLVKRFIPTWKEEIPVADPRQLECPLCKERGSCVIRPGDPDFDASKFNQWVRPEPYERPEVHDERKEFIKGRHWILKNEISSKCEVALGKGQGQYHTTIGFLDVVLKAHQKWSVGSLDLCVLIEVKIAPVTWSELLRQLALYKQYIGLDPYHFGSERIWVAALAFKPPAGYVERLKEEGVHTLRLADKFQEWTRSRTTTTASPIDEV